MRAEGHNPIDYGKMVEKALKTGIEIAEILIRTYSRSSMHANAKVRVIVFFAVLVCSPAAVHSGQFKVTRVYDGDTVKAEGCDVEIKVRLMGIDAPEISHEKNKPSQPYGQTAKDYLTDLIYGKTVDVKGWGMDKYGRVLGVISVDGKNVNLEMVRAGLAEVYRGKVRSDFDLMPYHALEREARNLQKGIWSVGTIYVSPKVWREQKGVQ
jgi:micrococcal nuclease